MSRSQMSCTAACSAAAGLRAAVGFAENKHKQYGGRAFGAGLLGSSCLVSCSTVHLHQLQLQMKSMTMCKEVSGAWPMQCTPVLVHDDCSVLVSHRCFLFS
jgi:hypothetical protein